MNVGRPHSVERFWSKVNKGQSCWLWAAGKTRSGYGLFAVAPSKNMRSHRFIWVALNGAIPPNMSVCHRCDNPACVNPCHLFLGTAKDNATDRDNKGRNVRGARQWKAKLTDSCVQRIRERLAAGSPRKQVASEFGISKTQMGRIAKGEAWRAVSLNSGVILERAAGVKAVKK